MYIKYFLVKKVYWLASYVKRGLLKHFTFRYPKISRLSSYLKNKLFFLKDFVILSELYYFINHKKKLEALISPLFMKGLLKLIYKIRATKGEIIELGTYRGGSTIMCARFIKRIGITKRIYTCDSFDGLPYDDKFTLQLKRKGKFSDTNLNYVRKKFKEFNVNDKIFIIKGNFEKTLIPKVGNKRFSLAFIDCDLYDSTRYALNFLYPRMEKKSIICFHDYDKLQGGDFIWGIVKAIDDFCREKKKVVNIKPIPHIYIF